MKCTNNTFNISDKSTLIPNFNLKHNCLIARLREKNKQVGTFEKINDAISRKQ